LISKENQALKNLGLDFFVFRLSFRIVFSQIKEEFVCSCFSSLFAAGFITFFHFAD
tara:strand:+ start:52 stop:219 length:168 start_codon:yes stop_codon:yes gene_type:complete